jgi:dephospho-CoA kinase
MARNQLDEAQVRAIMAAQVTREQRRAAADDIIVNDDGLEQLRPQVEALHARYLDLARAGTP